jgi:translation initiation factor 3 subunit D
MAEFVNPIIQDNKDGWGPCQLPEKFRDMPYQPFSKSDRLGKVSDWTGTTYTDRKYVNKYQSQFAGTNQYTYYHEDDESSFKLVDNTTTKPRSHFFRRGHFRGFRGRGRGGQWGHRGQDSRGNDNRQGGGHQRGRKAPWNNRWNNNRGRYNRWGNDDRRKDASVKVEEDWEVIREIEFNQFSKLRSELPEAEDLYECGSVETYDVSYDRITPKGVRPMKKSAADRNFNTCAGTTTDDMVIRDLRHQGQVFATDSILSTLMCASRSVNPWDIIVRRIGNKLFFDRRDGSEIDMVSVNETANEQPNEDNSVPINDPRNLTLEATYINKVFGQQCLKQGEWNDLEKKNEFIDPNMPKDRIASAGYRYRRWQLGEYSLVARTTVDAVTTSKKTGNKTYALIRALNEWDPKNTGDWRKKLESQPGAVLATELKNNNNKLARWTTQAVMAGCKSMKIAYVVRNNAKNNREHSIVQVSQFRPKDFATQMQLNLENSWGVLRSLIEECMQLPAGKYLLLKDPNNQKILLYSIPEDTFR